MFGADPIDLADPSPYLPISYYGHLLIGTIALLAAIFVFASRKGGLWHKRGGYLFIASVAAVCLTSVEMLANVFIAPLFMAVFTAVYAIGGAWLSLQKDSVRVRLGEYALFLFEIAGIAIFLSIALPAAASGVIPPAAPIVIVIIPLILLGGDINWFARRHERQRLRVQRHLARMVWGFVVVLRAPLVELAAAGLPLPAPLVIAGPIVLGVGMLLYFQRRYGALKKHAAG